MKVIIWTANHNLKYIYLTNFKYFGMKGISEIVNELNNEYDWFLDLKQAGGTMQGVLDIDDINIGIEVAKKIMEKFPETTVLIAKGEVIKDEKSPLTMSTDTNNSEGYWEPGRYFDKIKYTRTGIFNFETKKWI